MTTSYIQDLEWRIKTLKEQCKRDDLRPNDREKSIVLHNYYLDLVQTIDNNYLNN